MFYGRILYTDLGESISLGENEMEGSYDMFRYDLSKVNDVLHLLSRLQYNYDNVFAVVEGIKDFDVPYFHHCFCRDNTLNVVKLMRVDDIIDWFKDNYKGENLCEDMWKIISRAYKKGNYDIVMGNIFKDIYSRALKNILNLFDDITSWDIEKVKYLRLMINSQDFPDSYLRLLYSSIKVICINFILSNRLEDLDLFIEEFYPVRRIDLKEDLNDIMKIKCIVGR